MVNPIVPDAGRTVAVFIIPFKQTDRMLISQSQHNLALLPDIAGIVVFIHNINVIRRNRFSHRTRLWLEPFKGCQRNTHFRLSKSFIQLMSGHLQKLIVDFRVQRFSGNAAMMQGGKVIFCQVLFNKKTVDCRRCAKGGDFIILHDSEQVMWNKAFIIIGKHRRSTDPLSIDFTPGSLRPACVRNSQMKTVVLNLLPKMCGQDMSKRIGIVMCYHLRITSGTGCKIQKHQVVVLCCFTAGRPDKIRRRLFQFIFKT